MKAFYGFIRFIGILLSAFTAILAGMMLVYSGYVIYDNYYTGQEAFSSRELAQFKPDPNKKPKLEFKKIRKINPDVSGWIEIFDTNIDYPIVHGKSDVEYANKDVWGKSSLTGSIYLEAKNDPDFKDIYNIVYGHNMKNGAMFGGLREFLDWKYFSKHRKGFLQTAAGNYYLDIFASIKVDAFDYKIYKVIHSDRDRLNDLLEHIRNNSDVYVKGSSNGGDKVIALSTCYNAKTYGRLVILANAKKTDVIPKRVKENYVKRYATGHKMPKEHWAILNLICVLLMFLTLLPLTQIRKKYHQYKVANDICNKLNQVSNSENLTEDLEDKQSKSKIEKTEEETTEVNKDLLDVEKAKEISDQMKYFIKKLNIGFFVEIILLIVAVVFFIITEDLRSPMVLLDKWTGIMILLFAISLLADFILFRYRGERPTNEMLKQIEEIITEDEDLLQKENSGRKVKVK